MTTLIVFLLILHPQHVPTIVVVLGAVGLLAIGPIDSAWKHPCYRIAFGAFLVFPGLYEITTAGLRISVGLVVLGGALIVGGELYTLLRDD